MACLGKCLLRFPEAVGSSPASAWDSAAVAHRGETEAGSCPGSTGYGVRGGTDPGLLLSSSRRLIGTPTVGGPAPLTPSVV